MKLLLDTHTLIWWDREPDLIPSTTLTLMQQAETQLLVSIVSLWEIQIKALLNRSMSTPSSPALLPKEKGARILVPSPSGRG